MRIFIALKLPLQTVKIIYEHVVSLREKHPDVRWTREENLHITVAFLGELDEQGMAILNEAVSLAVQKTKPMAITMGKLFTLPKGRPANVLALDIDQGKNTIAALSADVERIVTDLGKQKEYPFRHSEKRNVVPHITLARRGSVPITLSPEERNTPLQIQGTIDTLTIFKSDLYRTGPVYTPVAVYPL
jgi:2'-5' RNA ligase